MRQHLSYQEFQANCIAKILDSIQDAEVKTIEPRDVQSRALNHSKGGNESRVQLVRIGEKDYDFRDIYKIYDPYGVDFSEIDDSHESLCRQLTIDGQTKTVKEWNQVLCKDKSQYYKKALEQADQLTKALEQADQLTDTSIKTITDIKTITESLRENANIGNGNLVIEGKQKTLEEGFDILFKELKTSSSQYYKEHLDNAATNADQNISEMATKLRKEWDIAKKVSEGLVFLAHGTMLVGNYSGVAFYSTEAKGGELETVQDVFETRGKRLVPGQDTSSLNKFDAEGNLIGSTFRVKAAEGEEPNKSMFIFSKNPEEGSKWSSVQLTDIPLDLPDSSIQPNYHAVNVSGTANTAPNIPPGSTKIIFLGCCAHTLDYSSSHKNPFPSFFEDQKQVAVIKDTTTSKYYVLSDKKVIGEVDDESEVDRLIESLNEPTSESSGNPLIIVSRLHVDDAKKIPLINREHVQKNNTFIGHVSKSYNIPELSILSRWIIKVKSFFRDKNARGYNKLLALDNEDRKEVENIRTEYLTGVKSLDEKNTLIGKIKQTVENMHTSLDKLKAINPADSSAWTRIKKAIWLPPVPASFTPRPSSPGSEDKAENNQEPKGKPKVSPLNSKQNLCNDGPQPEPVPAPLAAAESNGILVSSLFAQQGDTSGSSSPASVAEVIARDKSPLSGFFGAGRKCPHEEQGLESQNRPHLLKL